MASTELLQSMQAGEEFGGLIGILFGLWVGYKIIQIVRKKHLHSKEVAMKESIAKANN